MSKRSIYPCVLMLNRNSIFVDNEKRCLMRHLFYSFRVSRWPQDFNHLHGRRHHGPDSAWCHHHHGHWPYHTRLNQRRPSPVRSSSISWYIPLFCCFKKITASFSKP